MSVNKASISKEISEEINISNKDSLKIVNSFLSLVINNAKSKKVKISDFGSFYSHSTPKRIGRNPKTKESYIIEPMKKIVFKASSKIKNFLNK
tara:strand:+ start:2593 stop:2871 length:279 start_codon:yes stop_codon:yes gene_type:complete